MSKKKTLEEKIQGVIDVQGQKIAEIGKAANTSGLPCEVSCSLGKTINLGNYESLRIDVSAKIVCAPDEIEQATVSVSKWVKANYLKEKKWIEDNK